MTTHQLHQALTNVGRSVTVRWIGAGLSLLALVAAFAAYALATRPSVQSSSSARPVVMRAAASPAQTSSGSAYDGRAYQPQLAVARAAGASNPIQIAASSAYTGQTTAAAPQAFVRAASSTVLGITLPYGTDAHNLPFGITDYLRADAPPVGAAAVSSVLGIELPAGATRAGLPSGLTDYLRPQQADQPVAAQPQAQRYLLGGHGELVAGASNVQALPRITAASPALIGTGSAYDGGHYVDRLSTQHVSPKLPVIRTSSAYDGQ